MQQERDHIPVKRVTVIGTIAVIITILAAVIAYLIVPKPPSPTAITEREIAGVEQVHALDGWAVRLQIEQRQKLESYGWSNAEHTEAHVPIDKAMHDLVTR